MNTDSPHKYYVVYKPFGMLSQFSKEGERPTLKDLGDLPGDVYPVGRLDADSEGLLILTNDGSLNSRLLHPKNAHHREYWAQVEGEIDDFALSDLAKGVEIKVNKKTYKTKPASAERMVNDPLVPDRDPPIRFRKSVPTSWLRLVLTEGKNRQVRKMTAATGFPTLRLIRWKIEALTAEGMQPGDILEIPKKELFAALQIP